MARNPVAKVIKFDGATFAITKWCKSITDDNKDWYRGLDVEWADKLIHRFRLKDDDGVIYAYGVCDNYSSFAPVDYYEGDYGCVVIEYYVPLKKEWEVL